MTVSLDEQEDIRRMDRDGVPRARIARELHLSRNTVQKYAERVRLE
jgi:DNA-binding NarL/FixJ family response regulator